MPAGSLRSSSTRPGTGCRRRSSSRAGPNRRAAASASRPKLPQRFVRSLATFEERVRRLGERLGPVRVVLESPRDDGLLALLLGSTELAARARLPGRELARRRRRPGGAGRTTGMPRRRFGISASASRRTTTTPCASSPVGSGRCSIAASRCTPTSATRTSRRPRGRPGGCRSSSWRTRSDRPEARRGQEPAGIG